MAESFNLLRRVKSLDTAPETDGYSGVTIFAGQDEEGNNIEYFAGDRSGTVLEITNEWGSQAQADAIYRKIRGYRYQPYKAAGTTIDPSVEIGDAVTIADTYGGVFLRATDYRDTTSDLEAPSNEEIEHEFQIQSPTNRQYERFTRSVRSSLTITATKIAAEVAAREASDQEFRSALEITASRISAEVSARENADNQLRATLDIQAGQIQAEVEARTNGDNQLRATLDIQAGQISAKVSKSGGDPRSFGWDLLDSSMVWYSSGTETARLDSSGAKIRGRIEALSGKIGGFDIGQDSLSYNGQTWGGTNTWGGYYGINGFQMGRNFKVDMAGNLEAASGRFTGEVYAGRINYGGDAGHLWGEAISEGSISGGWDGQIAGGSIGTFNTSGGINTSLGYADFSNGVFNGWNSAPSLSTGDRGLVIGGHTIAIASTSFRDGTGGTVSLRYLMWI